MKKLAICGKTIDISKIAEKSAAQFRDQLKRNGIVLTDEEFDAIWAQIQKSINRAAAKQQNA